MSDLNNRMKDIYEQQISTLPSEVIEVINDSIINANKEVKGLQIGDTAPNFKLNDVNDKTYDLYEHLEKGPAIIKFFRGEWCPFCNLDARVANEFIKTFKSLGASYLSLTPETKERAERMIENNGINFPLLLDEKQSVSAAYNVRFELVEDIVTLYKDSFDLDLAKLNFNAQWNLPVPATFVVDTDKIIKSRSFNHDFRVRMEPEDILNALHNLPETTPEPMYEEIVNQ